MAAACSPRMSATTPDGAIGDGKTDAYGNVDAAGDVYAAVYAAVDPTRLETLLRDMTGYNTISLNGQQVRIAERYTPASKALWRAYFTQYYTALGATIREIDYPVANLVGETTGHNLEAVFPGTSPDSIVAIVHYDSTGAPGKEAQNPGVDDNMTPMAIEMEAARVIAQHPDRALTVRFVATDYEEITTITGGKAYVADLAQRGVHVVAAVDGELSGWNCWKENACGSGAPPPASALVVAASSCDGKFAYAALGQQMKQVAQQYSPMAVSVECDSDTDGSELYNFWRVNTPAFYFEEFANDNNTYYDEGGDDTLAHIDLPYYDSIGRVAAVMIAKLVGL